MNVEENFYPNTLTFNCELSRRLAIFCLAGVFPSIALLHIVDEQFDKTTILLHLVLLSTLQDHSAFPPVHGSSRFGQLPAKHRALSFLHHQALDVSFKCDRKSCCGCNGKIV